MALKKSHWAISSSDRREKNGSMEKLLGLI